MSTIVTRSGKGSPLTHNEVDTNFTNLNTDKVEKTAAAITGGTIDNTTIGATTPSTGVFTTLTATGQTKLGGASGSNTVQVDTTTNTGQYTLFTRNNSINEQQIFSAGGSGSNLGFSASGLGDIWFRTNSGGQTQAKIAHTASAVNYHQLTGSATGSGPIHSVAGSDTNIDLNLTTKGTGAVNLNTGSNVQFKATEAGVTNTSWTEVQGGISATKIYANGSSSNIEFRASSKGTGSVALYTNAQSQLQLNVAHTASAVNYVQVTGAATGGTPTISVQGSDTNAGMLYNAKGFGSHTFRGYNGSNTYLTIGTSQASPVNSLQLAASSSGNAVSITALGSDTNIPLVLQPKGTGALQAQQTDSTATGGNARGANAVDWQTVRSSASQVANNTGCVIGGGSGNTASSLYSGVASGLGNLSNNLVTIVAGGQANSASGGYSSVVGGVSNTASAYMSIAGGGYGNTASGYFNFIGGGFTNSGTANATVTTQSGTMNATTAVTLSGSNANIKVGQYITGTSIAAETYVSAISGTSLTLSKVASGSGTATLSFFTPHGVVIGGGNNQATGSYSFIGGGGDAGTAANRNVASGDWSVVGGGIANQATGLGSVVVGGGIDAGGVNANIASGVLGTIVGGLNNQASGRGSFIGGGYSNRANGIVSSVIGGTYGTARSITANMVFAPVNSAIASATGVSQTALLILAKQTTDATATVLVSDNNSAGSTNQVILPNNSAYYFKGSVIANVTGGGNTKAWAIEGAIKRGANAASTALVGTPTVTSAYADVGAATWAITATADTTNGGLAITFTGQASTTIRCVCKLETTEVTF